MLYQTIIRFGIILIFLFSLQSSTRAAKSSEEATITGRIMVIGSAPGSVLLRTSNTGDKEPGNSDYLITGPLAGELRKNFRGKVVTLEGNACASPSRQFARCFKPASITVD